MGRCSWPECLSDRCQNRWHVILNLIDRETPGANVVAQKDLVPVRVGSLPAGMASAVNLYDQSCPWAPEINNPAEQRRLPMNADPESRAAYLFPE